MALFQTNHYGNHGCHGCSTFKVMPRCLPSISLTNTANKDAHQTSCDLWTGELCAPLRACSSAQLLYCNIMKQRAAQFTLITWNGIPFFSIALKAQRLSEIMYYCAKPTILLLTDFLYQISNPGDPEIDPKKMCFYESVFWLWSQEPKSTFLAQLK